MLGSRMQAAINQQINAETYSAYLYMAMAAYFDNLKLGGFSHWMTMQVQEELSHAMIFYKYVYERRGTVTLTQIDTPPAAWSSPLACAKAVLSHEQLVTCLINNLVDMARQEGDKTTEKFLQWFVDEQGEEEESASELIARVEMAGNSPLNLLLVDKELNLRVFHKPSILTL